MQEIVLFLTGVAGAASAVAYKRRPRAGWRGAGRRQEQEEQPRQEQEQRPQGGGAGGSAGRIREKIHALAAERDILGKTIARAREDRGLDARQKDALLAMYQRQLGAVLAKIDRLEEASRYPDLGPVGDGLLALMDQKLSSLDGRLDEMSAKIAAAAPGAAPARPERRRGKKPGREPAPEELPAGEAGDQAAGGKQAVLHEAPVREGPKSMPGAAQRPAAVKPVEITTLTTINGGRREFPAVQAGGAAAAADKQGRRPQAAAGQAAAGQAAADRHRTDPKAASAEAGAAAAASAVPQAHGLPASLPAPKPIATAGEELEAEADDGAGEQKADDDLAAIMADIRSTISKLEQAEVE